MKKKAARRIGNRCLICRKKALPETFACKSHQNVKVDAKHFVLPYVILKTDVAPVESPRKHTLYECARCGYGLLTEEERVERLHRSPS